MRGLIFRPEMIRRLAIEAKTQSRRPLNEETLRVDLHSELAADFARLLPKEKRSIQAGRHRAKLNKHGAVTVISDGCEIGAKPGEFHFVCPFLDGPHTTALADVGGGRKVWTITPKEPSRLYVKERINLVPYRLGHVDPGDDPRIAEATAHPAHAVFAADREICDFIEAWPWENRTHLSAMFMPQGARRFELLVHQVRIERLQDITEEDAFAEGVEPVNDPEGDCWTDGKARTAFQFLWNEIHGWEPNAWEANPWCWALAFKLERREA